MTVAAVAIALLALSAAPASGGFRYVPPAEPESAAEPAAKGTGALHEDIEPRPGPGQAVLGPSVSGPNVSGRSVAGPRVSGTSVWKVHAGEMLRGVLARWGARAGTKVLFLTDRRYRLDGDAAFEGGFADAVQALFRSLSHLPHAPVATRSEGGATLVVRHRMPASPARGETP